VNEVESDHGKEISFCIKNVLVIHFVLRDYNTSVGNPEWNFVEFSTVGGWGWR